MRTSTLCFCLFPLGALAQSEPASRPSAELEDLLTRTCLSYSSDTADRVRRDACSKYIEAFPNGVWLEDVQSRLRELSPASTSAPTEVEPDTNLDLSEFAHPRKAGDATVLVGVGANSPSGSFGFQGGYYATPRLQLSGGLGVDDKHIRGGVLSRFYLRDSRISPSALLGLSFAPGREATGEGINPLTGDEQVVSIKLGPSLLAHAGLGLSFRYISGFSLNAEGGYAQPLFQQNVTFFESDAPPLSNEAKVLDGGFFVSIALGYTFSQLF